MTVAKSDLSLLPCPLCGGEAMLIDDDVFKMFGPMVVCTKCGMDGPSKETYEEAVKSWNTRADDRIEATAYWQQLYKQTVAENARLEAALRTALQNSLGNWPQERTCTVVQFDRCSVCSAQLDSIYGNYCPNCGAKVVDE